MVYAICTLVLCWLVVSAIGKVMRFSDERKMNKAWGRQVQGKREAAAIESFRRKTGRAPQADELAAELERLYPGGYDDSEYDG